MSELSKSALNAVGNNQIPRQTEPQLKRAWDECPRSLTRENALRFVQKLRRVGGYQYDRRSRTIEFTLWMEPATLHLNRLTPSTIAN